MNTLEKAKQGSSGYTIETYEETCKALIAAEFVIEHLKTIVESIPLRHFVSVVDAYEAVVHAEEWQREHGEIK